ncbi:MAG: hypothetical protein V3V16_08565 [Melioribacteraceae bacterium]
MADFEKLDNLIIELEKESNILMDFNKVFTQVENLKQEISDNIGLLKENNESFETVSKSIQSKLENSEKRIELLKIELFKHIQALYEDNKNFQKEFDSSLVSRLDKYKSDIQVAIRNEGTQIQKNFENSLSDNLYSIESRLKEYYHLQKKQFKFLKIMIGIVVILVFVLLSKL